MLKSAYGVASAARRANTEAITGVTAPSPFGEDEAKRVGKEETRKKAAENAAEDTKRSTEEMAGLKVEDYGCKGGRS